MFQSETLTPRLEKLDLRFLPLSLSGIAGVVIGLTGLLALDLVSAYRAEGLLREVTDEIAENLSPRVPRDSLMDLQAAAEQQVRVLMAGSEIGLPEVSVTVIGSRIRVRAFTSISARLIGRWAFNAMTLDVSGTATAPRPRPGLA